MTQLAHRPDDQPADPPTALSPEMRAQIIADAAMSIAIHPAKRREHIKAVALEQIRNAVAVAIGGRDAR